MECRNTDTSDPMVLQNLMRDLAIRRAAGAGASTVQRPGPSIGPPVVAPADVFGPYAEPSWDPVGDAEYEARLARRIAAEAQRGKRKRPGSTNHCDIRDKYYRAGSEDSEEETLTPRTKRQNPGFNPTH